jgi:putative lipoprotein
MAGGLALAGGLLLACSAPSRPADAPGGFVNRVWKVSQSSTVAPGTLYAFLSEGTMVIASEYGTPSLGQWRQRGDTLTLVEEGLPYRTEVLQLARDTFKVRIHNPGEPVEITFVPAEGEQAAMSKETRSVSGTVAYRERMALPADAVVQVQLSDVSRQDAPAPVIAETTFTAGGRQVPLPFELRYAAEQIESSHSYAVRATIRQEGMLLFTTDAVHSVITRGNPEKVDLMLVRTRGEAPVGPTSGGLVGTAWQLEDLGGAGVIDNSMTTLEFIEAARVGGRGGCNRFFGSVEITGESIKFGQMGSTQMACVEALMNQEGRYLKALGAAERYALNGDQLLLYSKGFDKPLRFTRMKQ